MLNEPVQEAGQGGGGGGGVAEAGGMNYIQVTPQEKEAIERVKLLIFQFENTILAPQKKDILRPKQIKIICPNRTNPHNLKINHTSQIVLYNYAGCGTSRHVLFSIYICIAVGSCTNISISLICH